MPQQRAVSTPNCPECASSNLEWVESPGKGKVYTYVITRQPVSGSVLGRGGS